MTLEGAHRRDLIGPGDLQTVDITDDYIASDESPRVNRLFKLVKNGKSLFDDFISVNPKKVNNKKKIIEELDAYLTLLIEGEDIPPNKLHKIGSNEFEIRVNRTRLYFFFDHPNRNIIVLGHYNKKKDDQQEYIDKFRKLKNQYFNQFK